MKSYYKERGVFTTELAIVAVFFSLILIMAFDIVMKQSIKGGLDRLSYSIVNLIRERTYLHAGNEDIVETEINAYYEIAKNSISAQMRGFEIERFGMFIEQLTFDSTPPRPALFEAGNYSCKLNDSLSNSQELSPVTYLGHKLPLYRVTLCYQSYNWYGTLIGESYEMISSSSLGTQR